MKAIAMVLSLLLVSPAFGAEAWDGLKVPQGQAYSTGNDHPASTSQNSVGHTLLASANPIYQALTLGWQGAAHSSWVEFQGFWFVPYGMVVGSWLEHRTNPRKFGKFQYNGHVVTGEAAKWERDPEHPGWNRLVRYDTIGPGKNVQVAKKFVHEYTYGR
jgi:hypothetical protein